MKNQKYLRKNQQINIEVQYFIILEKKAINIICY
jgi:hypothetical protein